MREAGVGVGGLDQLGQQRTALRIHPGDGRFLLLVQRKADDGCRHRAVARFHAGHAGHEAARGLADAFAGHHLPEPGHARRHVVMRAQHLGLFHVEVRLRSHQHQIAGGNRAAVHGGAQLRGHLGPRVEAIDIGLEAAGGTVQRVQRQPRHQQHDQRQRAKTGHELGLDRKIAKAHGDPPFPEGLPAGMPDCASRTRVTAESLRARSPLAGTSRYD
ncbi:hypothetical protein D3C81_1337940 [compost metagenome]